MDDNILVVLFIIILTITLFNIVKNILVKYHGPDSNQIRNNIHYDKNTGKCYSFKPVIYICPINESMK